MNIPTTITGLLIAAMLNVPGTNQREVTTVGEEPVIDVKSQTEIIKQNDVWYVYTGTSKDENLAQYESDILKPESYMNTESPTYTGCNGSYQICAIRLEDSNDEHPDAGDFASIASDIENESDASGNVQLQPPL